MRLLRGRSRYRSDGLLRAPSRLLRRGGNSAVSTEGSRSCLLLLRLLLLAHGTTARGSEWTERTRQHHALLLLLEGLLRRARCSERRA